MVSAVRKDFKGFQAMLMEEGTLISEFNKGSKVAFSAIYTRLYPGVKRVANFYLSSEDAADATADTFIKLWSAERSFKDIEHVKAWLYRTIQNGCIDKLRKEKNKREISLEQVNETSTFTISWLDDRDAEEIRQYYLKLIDSAIAQLPSEKQAIFKLAYIEHLKNPEIADSLNVNLKKVKNEKGRLVLYLRDFLKEKGIAVVSCIVYLLFTA